MSRSPLPPRPLSLTPIGCAVLVGVFILVVWDLDIHFADLFSSREAFAEFFGRFGSPDFRKPGELFSQLGVTFAMAVWGTFLALLIGLILGPLAARPMTPHGSLFRVSRLIATVLRCVPDPLLALVLVSGVTMESDALPGIIALGFHTGGFLAKFFADSLERVPSGVYEGVAATGASRFQLLCLAGWPSIGRELVGHTLFVLDRNVRMACVLGLIGAGGIGMELKITLAWREYDRSAAILLLILGTILVVDYASAFIRGRLR